MLPAKFILTAIDFSFPYDSVDCYPQNNLPASTVVITLKRNTVNSELYPEMKKKKILIFQMDLNAVSKSCCYFNYCTKDR